MKKIRFRHSNGVDLTATFSAKILGGGRGFIDACALESFSNKVFPCVRVGGGHTAPIVVTIGYEEKREHSVQVDA